MNAHPSPSGRGSAQVCIVGRHSILLPSGAQQNHSEGFQHIQTRIRGLSSPFRAMSATKGYGVWVFARSLKALSENGPRNGDGLRGILITFKKRVNRHDGQRRRILLRTGKPTTNSGLKTGMRLISLAFLYRSSRRKAREKRR